MNKLPDDTENLEAKNLKYWSNFYAKEGISISNNNHSHIHYRFFNILVFCDVKSTSVWNISKLINLYRCKLIIWYYYFPYPRPQGLANICLTCIFVPVGLGAFCALGAKRQHKMWQRKYQVEAVVIRILSIYFQNQYNDPLIYRFFYIH